MRSLQRWKFGARYSTRRDHEIPDRLIYFTKTENGIMIIDDDGLDCGWRERIRFGRRPRANRRGRPNASNAKRRGAT